MIPYILSVDPYALAALVAVVVMSATLIRQRWVVDETVVMFQDSMDAGRQGVLFFDQRGRLRKANRQARSYLPFLEGVRRYAMSDFLDYLFDSAVDVDEGLRQALRKSALDPEGGNFREIIDVDDGAALCLVEVRKMQSGKTVVLMRDVTRMREQEDHVLSLNKMNYELSQAIESSTCGVLLSDPKMKNHRVIFANQACADVFGIDADQMSGMALDEVFVKLGYGERFHDIAAAYHNHQALRQEIRVVSPHCVGWFDFSLTPVFDDAGGLDLFIAVFTDMTALKTQEAEFFKAQKLDALGRLAAGVAHDFNNMLSIVDGYSRMILNHLDRPDIVTAHIDKMQMATKRGAALTRQMLTFSRHKIAVNSAIDFGQEVAAQEALLVPLMQENISIHIEVEGEKLYGECSADNLSQILVNLGINARDAMPDGGQFSVVVEPCGWDELPIFVNEDVPKIEFLCLRVSDTGMGMEKDVQAQIFDPFYTTKDAGKGTGLGLSVVYGMVKELSGFIHVESELGCGTTFYIYIPLSDKAPPKQISGSFDDWDNIELTGYTALVAEDEPDLRAIICDTLEKRGMIVLYAGDGDEALALQDDYVGDIDILLTDVVMPGMDGLKLGELFQAMRPDTQVVYMSGYPANGDMARVSLPDDAYFIAKPVDYEMLCKLVFACLTGKDAETFPDLLRMTAAHWQTQNTVEIAGGEE